MEHDSPALRNAVQSLASQALPAFGLALAAALAGVCAVWWLVQRQGARPESSRFTPLASLLGFLALGFGLIIGAAAVFAEIAEQLGDGRQLGQLDQLFSDTVQATLSPGVFRAFALLTHLGDPLTLAGLGVAVAVLLLWQRQPGLCVGWALALGGNAVLNTVLKRIFERTRPVHDNLRAFADGWSFPSGHASGSLVAYGMLAYLAVRLLPARWSDARLPALLLATAVVFIVCASRVFVQVHFATDVLAGMASGSAWLAVCIGALELVRYHRQGEARHPA